MKLEITLKNGTREYEVAQTPTEGMLFEVNPLGIDRSRLEEIMRGQRQEINRSRLEETMRDMRQEYTRQIIQYAFAEVNKHPEKYASAFYTLMPEMKWEGIKTVQDPKVYVNDLGGKMADLVEQGLEWAQRIFNGESWEEVCNNEDTANWYRMIIGKNGRIWLVGDSLFDSHGYSVTHVIDLDKDYRWHLRYTCSVPLLVVRKKLTLSTIAHF